MAKSVELAVLCAAASFRDDLLSILDAGISTITAQTLPAVAEVTFVAQLFFTEPDLGSEQKVCIQAQGDQEAPLASMSLVITPERPPDADAALPYIFTLIQRLLLPLSKEGLYTVTVALEGASEKRLPLRVRT